MTKKLIIFVLVIVLAFSLVGCGGSDKEEAKDDKKQEEKADKEDDKKSKGGKLDNSLTGAELLSSIEYSAADSLVMTTELTMADGGVSTSTTYTKGQNMRMESQSDYGDTVMIYNAKEGMTYQWTVGDTQGIAMSDDSGMDMDMDMDMDMGAPTLEALMQDMPNFEASVEKLDGEEVVYIESTDDTSGEQYTIKMWYSAKYAIPLKYEAHTGGQVMMSSVVTDIDYNGKIDDKMFLPPDDVEFMNYSMDDMFGDMENMEDMEEMFGDMQDMFEE